MKLAIDAATGTAEPTAWTHVQLGKLYFNHGRFAAAEREFRLRERGLPALRLRARRARRGAGRAREAPRRDRLRARGGRRSIPLPQYVAALGDLYAVDGPARQLAQRQYALIGAIEKLLRANGVRTDLEIALFDVDHGIRLRHALELARIGAPRAAVDRRRRRARLGARAQRPVPRRRCRTRSTRCGSARRTRLKFFHRGMIERCLGRRRRGAGVVPAGAGAEPALLAALGAGRARGTRGEAAARRARRGRRARGAGRGVRAPARQLHGQPLQRARRRGQPALRRLRARPGGDPDVPGRRPAAASTPTAYARADRGEPAPDRRRQAPRGSCRCAASSRSRRARAA